MVEDRYQWPVVGDQGEVWDSNQVGFALGCGPDGSEQLQFDGGISGLGVGQETGAILNEAKPSLAMVLQ